MICPFCKTDNDKVVDSRVSGTAIRRRRECQACGRRFTTREYIEIQPLTVVKRNGEKEPFQREKLIRGIMNSCKKRPLSSEDIEQLATRVENALPVNDSIRYNRKGFPESSRRKGFYQKLRTHSRNNGKLRRSYTKQSVEPYRKGA